MIDVDNIFKNKAYLILELFIAHPNKDFSIRGIARDLGFSHATVIEYIDDLLGLALIRKNNKGLYPTYYANVENDKYKFYKRNYIIFQINASGFIEFLQNKCLASSIVLFGSCAKGTFTERSDIDIFVEAKKTNLSIAKYEKILSRKINLLFEPKIRSLSNELMNNILNGYVLNGSINVKK